jgi:hypothetical protein
LQIVDKSELISEEIVQRFSTHFYEIKDKDKLEVEIQV